MPLLAPSTRLRPSLTRGGLAVLSGTAVLVSALVAPAFAATRPARPGSLVVKGSGAARWLTWNESTSGTGFVVQQATNSSFTQGTKSYRMRGPGHALTPYGLRSGTTYWFRVRAVKSGVYSYWSSRVSYTASGGTSPVRVLSYNSMSASLDGQQHPGGVAAPWKDRRPGQLSLMKGSGADVIGIEEGMACIIKYTDGTNCYRQIDSISDGMSAAGYTLAGTLTTKASRYSGNYILFRNTVQPVGAGGTWYIGDTSSHNQTAVYQLFKVPSTGAQFLFVVTHLVTGSTSAGDKSREIETANMLKDASAFASNHGVTSIVYVGDFNSYVGEWGRSDLTGAKMRSSRIPDGVEVAQSMPRAQFDSINALYRTARKGHGSIDHIYATGGVGVRTWGELLDISSGKFVGTIPSDHNPVWAGLAIPY
jgi:endonuclease/exonuclease/phosphatase family metal-dependent hydrolase